MDLVNIIVQWPSANNDQSTLNMAFVLKFSTLHHNFCVLCSAVLIPVSRFFLVYCGTLFYVLVHPLISSLLCHRAETAIQLIRSTSR